MASVNVEPDTNFMSAMRDPTAFAKALLRSTRFKQLRDLLALVAVIKYGGELLALLADYGILGLFREMYKSAKRRVFSLAKTSPVLGGAHFQ